MQTIHIRNLRARYRLPPSARGERRRLDGALEAALAGPLEEELARLGIGDGEEVCIRDIFAQVRLRLSGADASLARALARALAEAIARALGGRSVGGVVRYASRVQAFVDMAAGVALEDLGRAWAWSQLGLWRAGARATRQEALEELVRALAAEPGAVVPVCSALAGLGLFGRLARRFTREQWRALAAAASEAAGVSLVVYAPATPLASDEMVPPAVMREAARAVSASGIARACAPSQPERHEEVERAVEVERALAVMVILEAGRAALSLRGAGARTLVDATVVAMRRRDGAPASGGADASEAEQGSSPTGFAKESQPPRDGGLIASLSHAEGRGPSASDTEGRGAGGARVRDGRACEELSAAAASEDERPLPVVRRRASTRFGGLLFLLGLLEDLGLPEEMSADESLRERTLRWSLHGLALALAPEASPDDAAALAFAGLPPDARPPSDGEGAPSVEESGRIASYAERVVGGLRARLEDWREGPRESLLRAVCLRRAEVVADPGWFEVRMSLDEVATDIRRAGLDLDPGYLPWLGAVVKFVYE